LNSFIKTLRNLKTLYNEFWRDSERRINAININLLRVVHTEQTLHNDTLNIRIISSRKATSAEKKYYEN
jgi:uncharacterized DUF497 family protein